MSTYADPQYVAQQLLPGVPLEEHIEYALQQHEAQYQYINGRVAARYTVPVVLATQPKAYQLLKDIERDLVMSDVLERARADEGEGSPLRWFATQIRERAMARLQEIVDGSLPLTDAAASTTHAGRVLYDGAADADAVPKFGKDVELGEAVTFP